MKKVRILILVFFLCILLAYVTNISSIPKNIVLFEGENIPVSTMFGVSINKEKEEPKAIKLNTIQISKKENYEVKLLNKISLKKIEANIIPKTKVVPLGLTIGLKLHTNGVLVVGMSEVIDNQNNKVKPYENIDIKEGDMIIEASGVPITNTNDFIQTINNSKGASFNLKYIRDNNIYENTVKAVQTSAYEYKLGLWVRDTAAGIGTITFYEPESKKFAALGHGIQDIDTDKLINISNGEITTANILDILKGKRGLPGEIRGSLIGQSSIGKILQNTKLGIYGNLDNLNRINVKSAKEVEVATRDEIKLGKAKILCSLENGKIEEYEIEIQKIYKNNNENNKSMIVKVTDKKLLEKTGGIIQGMSGSPIIQNGKFVGALTHVLVSDPTKGFAVFGDMMIKQMKEA